MTDARIGAVAASCTAHLQTPFPSRLQGAEIAGIDMVSAYSRTCPGKYT
jgi:hypothetical protein